jgi:tetratricopeptide (TPR) repeat protein
LFLEEMNRIAAKQMVILLLDTYEVTGAFLDEWIRGVLHDRYGDDLTANFRLCIAGRDPLDRNAWVDLETCIARSPLEPFTEEEARGFLRGKGIASEAVMAQIWRLSSGGLPLLVAMMAENAPTDPDAVVDPCELAVERFLKWEKDEEKRQLAQSGAMPRVLDADIVAVLGDGQFEWLKRCAFVIRDGGRWRYHSVVRDQMVRYQWQRSRWSLVHGKLAAFYEERRSALGLEVGKESEDQIWRDYSLEWIYHTICAAPQTSVGVALNGFLMALKYSSGFAQNWAKAIVQAGQETDCSAVRKWGGQLRDGMGAARENRYADVIPCLTALLGIGQVESKMIAVALANRGEVYYLLEQHKEALKDLNTAIELNSNYVWAISGRGQVYRALTQYQESLKDFDKAIELEPTAWEFGQRGITYRLMNYYEESLKDFDRAIELEPTDWKFGQRGETYRLMKKYEEALKDFDRAIELDSEYAWAITSRGQTYQALKQYEEALKDCDRAIELSPTDWNFAQRGETYRLLERYEEALKDFDRAIELDSENAWAIGSRGQIYQALKQYEQALKDFDQAIKLDSEDFWTISRRGEIYQFLGQFESSLQDFDRAIELDPEDCEWERYLRSLTLTKLDRPTEAQTDLQTAIALALAQAKQAQEPTHWQNNFNLALYYLAAGQLEDSHSLYDRASEASTDLIEDAIQDLDDYLALFPDGLRPTLGHRPQAREVRDSLSGRLSA